MSEFECLLTAMLIPLYGILFYIAGRGNIGDLIIEMLHDKLKELEEKQENKEAK